MRCKNCGKDLGDGMLPARCPSCGANLRNRHERTGAGGALASRRGVEGLTGIGKGSKKGRAKNYALAVLGALLVALFAGGLYYGARYLGAQKVQVPDVVGWRLARAEEELRGAGYAVSFSEVPNRSVQEGLVVSQTPEAGTGAAEGSTVVLVVAKAPVMPEVVGHSRQEAEEALEAQDIPFEVHEEASDEPAGTVTAASLAAGRTVAADTVVRLTVALAPTVPDVVGKTRLEAQNILVKAGLKVSFKDVPAPEGTPVGQVTATSPAAGAQVKTGSEVQVSVTASRLSAAKETAEAVLSVVYDNAAPTDESVGEALRPYLSPESPYASASAHDIWWKLVKQGGRHTDFPAELQSFPRTLVSRDLTVSQDGRSATAVLGVKWVWDSLGEEYRGVTSQDTHTVSMTFDDQGKLLTLTDDQTDVPRYRVEEAAS